jgi:hypothetical protein
VEARAPQAARAGLEVDDCARCLREVGGCEPAFLFGKMYHFSALKSWQLRAQKWKARNLKKAVFLGGSKFLEDKYGFNF